MDSKKEIKQDEFNSTQDVPQLNNTFFTYVPGSEAEKKLQRKIDLRLIPTIWLMYFLSYLGKLKFERITSRVQGEEITDFEQTIASIL